MTVIRLRQIWRSYENPIDLQLNRDLTLQLQRTNKALRTSLVLIGQTLFGAANRILLRASEIERSAVGKSELLWSRKEILVWIFGNLTLLTVGSLFIR